MKINKLKVSNWKIFKSTKHINFNNFEIVCMPNGTGKTSIFQAIIYGLFGKFTVGLNKSNVKNDDSLPVNVTIEFTIDSDKYVIERSFGNKSVSDNFDNLYRNDELLFSSINNIFNYMNTIIKYNLVNVLWNLASNDDILSPSFIYNYISNELLKDPNTIYEYYKKEMYYNNRKIKDLQNSINTEYDIEKLTDEYNKLESKIKNSKIINSRDYIRGKNTENAVSKAKAVKSKLKSFNFTNDDLLNNITAENASKLLKLFTNKSAIEERLSKELDKPVNKYDFSEYDFNEIRSILLNVKNSHKCLICGNESVNQDNIDERLNSLNLSTKDTKLINSITHDLNIIEKYDREDVNEYLKYVIELESLNNTINSFPNYVEVISSYNDKNNKIWEKFNTIKDLLSKATIEANKIQELENLNSTYDSYSKRIDFVSNYITKFNNYYIQKILDKSSTYLNNFNTDYKTIYIDNNTYYIIKKNQDGSIIPVNVNRLSSGEKLLVKVSILVLIHDLFTPSIPFLFDETFVNLDESNLERIIGFLKVVSENNQVFVITHDKTWLNSNAGINRYNW